MPWELTIRRPDGEPLGEVEEVCERIAEAVPDVQFYREPSGAERIAAVRARGIEFPEVVRQNLEAQPAKVRAVFEGGGLSVLLYGFEARPLVALHAEARGEGNPVPVLAALCRPNGWSAVDDATGRPVDLASAAAAGWGAFRAYHDRVISGCLALDLARQAESGIAPERRGG